MGIDPNKIAYRDEYAGPYRTVIGEDAKLEALQEAIRDALTDLVSEKTTQRGEK